MMTVHLDDEYGTDREKAHEVVWSIEATRILALGDVSTNVADMLVRIDLNDDDPPRTVADPLGPVQGRRDHRRNDRRFARRQHSAVGDRR